MRGLRMVLVGVSATLLMAAANPWLGRFELSPGTSSVSAEYLGGHSCVRLQFSGSKDLRVEQVLNTTGIEITFAFGASLKRATEYFRDSPIPATPATYTFVLSNHGSDAHDVRIAVHDGHCNFSS